MDNSLVGFLIQNYDNSVSLLVSKNLWNNIFNMLLYTVGVFVYVVVIWYFYQNLSKENLFDKEIGHTKSLKEGFFHVIWHFIIFLFRYMIIFPFISFVWFLILSGFLLFLSKSQDVSHILMMSTTVIAASRVTAYYKEDLSKDVAKLIPLSLLGIFIVDPTYFSIEDTLAKFYSVPLFLHVILQALIFLVIFEFSLRVIHKIRCGFSSKK